MARLLEARNHQAKPIVARIVGTTIASMIASASNRMMRSDPPTGPTGASTDWATAAVGNVAMRQNVAARNRIRRARVGERAGTPGFALRSGTNLAPRPAAQFGHRLSIGTCV